MVKTHKAKPPSHEEAAAALAEGFNQAREAREARHDKGLRDLHDKMQSQNAAFLKLHEQFEQTPTIGLFHELRIAMENCKETSSLFKAKIMELKAKKFESLELLSREVEESLRRENEWLAEQAQGVASGVLSKPDAQDGGE